MEEFMENLGRNIEQVSGICDMVEQEQEYLPRLREYLPQLNGMVAAIFDLSQDPSEHLEISQEFVLQVLQDILYGIEQEDGVFLLDTLRYGLLEVYYYVASELQADGQAEG